MFKLALTALMAFCISASAIAQEKPIQIYVSTGAAFPTRDFNYKYNYGFNGSVGVGFKATKLFRVVPKVEIQTFSIDQNISLDTVNGGSYTALMTGVDLRMFIDIPRWTLDPILLVGGGLAYSNVSALTVGPDYFESQSETKFYINVGAGLDVRLTPKICGFITGRYIRFLSSSNKTEFFPINVGIRF
jgi:opacity protein-like surface antigen